MKTAFAAPKHARRSTVADSWRIGLYAGAADLATEFLNSNAFLRACHDAKLRTRLGEQEFSAAAVLTGLPDTGLTGPEVLEALLLQLQFYSADASNHLRHRLEYFVKCQMCPFPVREKMADIVAFTFLPGGNYTAFPKDTTFWDLDKLEVLSLGTRLGRQVRREGFTPFKLDHFDVRILLFEMSTELGEIIIGGQGIDDDGHVYSRCRLSRTLAFEPGTDPSAMPDDDWDLLAQVLELHGSTEMFLAKGLVGQSAPRFPVVWLGFLPGSGIVAEPTAALKTRAYANVLAWLQSGSPMNYNHPEFEWAPRIEGALIGHDPLALPGWETVVNLTSPEEAQFILDSNARRMMRHFGGLECMPSFCFFQASAQDPWRRANRVLADMRPFLNRKVLPPDDLHGKAADIQFLQLVDRSVPPMGLQGRWSYDFSGAEIGMEAAMQ